MKIMVVGGGGREHAIIKKLKENKKVTEIYALPGNGGIAVDATCVDIGAKDINAITDFALKNKIDFASPALFNQLLPVGVAQTDAQKKLQQEKNEPINKWQKKQDEQAAKKAGWNKLKK